MLSRRIAAERGGKRFFISALTALLILTTVFTLSACAGKGTIVILEDGRGTGFTATLNEYDSTQKCELTISKGETVKIEIERDGGSISLAVMGSKDSEPYAGNNLRTGMFTLTLSETDDYVFVITGKKATGKITIKVLG